MLAISMALITNKSIADTRFLAALSHETPI